MLLFRSASDRQTTCGSYICRYLISMILLNWIAIEQRIRLRSSSFLECHPNSRSFNRIILNELSELCLCLTFAPAGRFLTVLTTSWYVSLRPTERRYSGPRFPHGTFRSFQCHMGASLLTRRNFLRKDEDRHIVVSGMYLEEDWT